jgi:NAD(P)-dependent dehydrogenase (short-subunit alcohol dehydrogenase family)
MQTTPTAIVTGASSGIGLAITNALLASGYNVVANARRVRNATTLSPSATLALVEGDVADPATGAALVQTALDRFGAIDLLVNNAGTFIVKPFDEYTGEDIAQLVATNVIGIVQVTQHVVRQMREQKRGHIVNISTSLASQPIAGLSAAVPIFTKGGLNAITKALALELASANIRVNAVAPGIVDTPMHPRANHEFLRTLHPIPRLATVDEVVQAVSYLNAAQFVTGEVVHVDGGAHAGRW